VFENFFSVPKRAVGQKEEEEEEGEGASAASE